MALKGERYGTYSTKHYQINLTEDTINNVRNELGIYLQSGFTEFEEMSNALAGVMLSDAELKDYLKEVFNVSEGKDIPTRTQNNMNRVVELFESPTNQVPGTRGTMWAAYNAVTEYADHEINVRDKRDFGRMDSVIFGRGAEIGKRALATALARV
jgi:hypothetical protein